jgi:hypothetical protein
LWSQVSAEIPTWRDQRGKLTATQNISIQKANELPQPVKSAVKRLLGRAIGPDEEVSIDAIPRRQVPPSESRAVLSQELEAFLTRRAEKITEASDAELDAAIDEAVDHVRHSRE